MEYNYIDDCLIPAAVLVFIGFIIAVLACAIIALVKEVRRK